MTKKGFTMMELIVYIAIASVVLVAAINVGWNLMIGYANTNSKQEVYLNSRLVMNAMGIKIREAEDVLTASSTFDTNPGVLTLDYPGADTDVIIDTYTKNIILGGQETTIRKLRMKEGIADYVDLTTDEVNITNFVLTDLTRGSEPDNINIELTIEKTNPGGNLNFAATFSLETAISLRQ